MGEPRKIGFRTRWKGKDGRMIAVLGHRVLPAEFPQESLDGSIFLSDFGITTKAGTSVAKKEHGSPQYHLARAFPRP